MVRLRVGDTVDTPHRLASPDSRPVIVPRGVAVVGGIAQEKAGGATALPGQGQGTPSGMS